MEISGIDSAYVGMLWMIWACLELLRIIWDFARFHGNSLLLFWKDQGVVLDLAVEGQDVFVVKGNLAVDASEQGDAHGPNVGRLKKPTNRGLGPTTNHSATTCPRYLPCRCTCPVSLKKAKITRYIQEGVTTVTAVTSGRLPRRASGAMKAGVPAVFDNKASDPSNSLHTPKSAICVKKKEISHFWKPSCHGKLETKMATLPSCTWTWPLSPSSKLDGLISRWMIF